MAKQIIKVRRSGIHVGQKSLPEFRQWLNAQPRATLTYSKDVGRKDEVGWTTPDFVLESIKRGVEVKFGTAVSWSAGHHPRSLGLAAIRRVFPNIQF